MSDNDISINLTADASRVAEAMAKAQQAVAEGIANIQISFQSLNDALAAGSTAKIASAAGETKATQQAVDQCLAIEVKYQAAKTKAVDKATKDRNKITTAEVNQVEKAWTHSLTKMLQGHASFGATLTSMWTSLVSTIVSQIARLTAEWLVSLLLQKEAKSKQIIDDAKTAATGAFSWGSHIGGPVLGAVSAAAAFAGTMAYDSAEGGYDIPTGVNPLTQLHAREMVLPAQHADVIRSLSESAGGAGAGTNITIHAVDAVSVRRLFQDHGSALVSALKSQNRNFAVM
jgi:hypothetical protein